MPSPRFLGTGQLILADILFRAGEPITSLSEYFSVAQGFVQRAYEDVLSANPWPWALADPPGIIQCVPAIEETATIATGSINVTLSASYAYSLVGYWLWLTDEEIPYRVASHTPPSAILTLDAKYQTPDGSAGGGSGISVELFKDEYSVDPTCLRIWEIWNRTDPDSDMDLITEGEMKDLYPNRDYGTWPKKAALMRGSKLRIVPWPQLNYCTLEYGYSQKPLVDLTFDGATTDIPVTPAMDNHVIADAALVYLYNLKNDSRASDMAQVVQAKLNLMENIYLPVGKTRMYVPRGKAIGSQH